MYLIILCYYDIIDRNINNNIEGIKYTKKRLIYRDITLKRVWVQHTDFGLNFEIHRQAIRSLL